MLFSRQRGDIRSSRGQSQTIQADMVWHVLLHSVAKSKSWPNPKSVGGKFISLAVEDVVAKAGRKPVIVKPYLVGTESELGTLEHSNTW